MREIVFALEFRGSVGPSGGPATTRRARTLAPSQTLRTLLGPDGIVAGAEPVSGDEAVLDSTVERFLDGSFVEQGTITYGRLGRVSFSTVGRGTVGPSPVEGWVHGAVTWVVTGGAGWFAGARGLITSNFVASAQGEVVDNQFARLALAGGGLQELRGHVDEELRGIRFCGDRLGTWFVCPRYAGRMQLIATIDAPVVIQRIFAHLGLPSARTGPPSPSFGAPARAKRPALSDMTLEQVPGARANSEVGAERPGGRRPLAASKLRFDLSRAP